MAKKAGNRREPEGKDSIRTFVCIEIPASIKQRMDDLESRLRRLDAQVSWVRPSNVHLTLKFLGAVPQDRIGGVLDAAERSAEATGAFEVEVGGAGCFPSARNPRVLWIGLTSLPDELIRLHSWLEREMEPLGFKPEARQFAPHLTIGRLRSSRNAAELGQRLADAGFEPERFVAREIIVMKSELKPTGSVYTPLRIIPLEAHN